MLAVQPVQLHGSFGRDAATGRGTVFATRELLKASGLGSLKGKEFVIQASFVSTFLSSDVLRQATLLGLSKLIMLSISVVYLTLFYNAIS